MIYLDTSVALAALYAEDRRPADSIWREPLVSSRLLEYELWNRVNGRGDGSTHGEAVREILARVTLVELAPPVLARALDPFPAPVRTLDAIHLATAHHLIERSQKLAIATYDERMRTCARKLGLALAEV